MNNQPNKHSMATMTLRDYFAAEALAASLTRFALTGRNEQEYEESRQELANSAYKWADRMLKAREETK